MIRILAPAKVNLTLRILGKRSNGYHDIESLVQKISLYDTITIAEEDGPGINLTCSDPTLPKDTDNLAHLAAKLLLESTGAVEKGISIHLEKRIPHGAGLGGGSSDAASVLLGVNSLLNHPLSRQELVGLAADIGSDVPLFLYPSPALIAGRGEKVQPSTVWINAVFVLVFPGFSISTKWAYSNYRLTKAPDKYTISGPLRTAGGALPPEKWQELLVNDLEEAVIINHPEIGRCKEALFREGAGAALMSGSGSAVYGLFKDQRSAEEAAERLMEDGSRITEVALPILS